MFCNPLDWSSIGITIWLRPICELLLFGDPLHFSYRCYHHWICRSKSALVHQDWKSSLCAWMLSTRPVQRFSRFISYHLLGVSGRSHCFNLLRPCFLQSWCLAKLCHVSSSLRLVEEVAFFVHCFFCNDFNFDLKVFHCILFSSTNMLPWFSSLLSHTDY